MRQDGHPIWVPEAGASAILDRKQLTKQAAGGYDEAWLQSLLHIQPQVLPIDRIEPGFGAPIPVCRELPLVFGAGKSGALDNLFVTADGGLILVETKLWRNPEARRSVVAQAMEYAAAVFRLSYEQLQVAVDVARKAAGEPVLPLTAIAAGGQDSLSEADFIDAVTRNLKRGRAIIAVVGDGIREDLVALAELLQTHAGHRFVFALVELAVYETPVAGARLIYPSVLAQTTLIERGVVRIEDGGSSGTVRILAPAVPSPTPAAARPTGVGLGEDEFYEVLDQNRPGLARLLREFLARAAAHGVYPDIQRGLNLKHPSPAGQPLNLGTVRKTGHFDTGPASWWDRVGPGRTYSEALATLIGGVVNDEGNQSALRTATGKTPYLFDLLPHHADAWIEAIDRYVAAFTSSDLVTDV
ncbi:MAG: hypothetical protein MIL41_01215 [Hyphomicrobiales bacterium]|jgi:hypothetical protein